MARKVSKNQRVNRGADAGHKDMVKVISAYRTAAGGIGYKEVLVEKGQVQATLAEAKRLRDEG